MIKSVAKNHRELLPDDINTVPLIDVMLVLLIVFMIAAPLALQGVELELPKADAASLSSTEVAPLTINVDRQGDYWLSQDGQSKPIQIAELVKIIELRGADTQLKIVVRGDRLVPYQYIARLVAALQLQPQVAAVGLLTEPTAL